MTPTLGAAGRLVLRVMEPGEVVRRKTGRKGAVTHIVGVDEELPGGRRGFIGSVPHGSIRDRTDPVTPPPRGWNQSHIGPVSSCASSCFMEFSHMIVSGKETSCLSPSERSSPRATTGRRPGRDQGEAVRAINSSTSRAKALAAVLGSAEATLSRMRKGDHASSGLETVPSWRCCSLTPVPFARAPSSVATNAWLVRGSSPTTLPRSVRRRPRKDPHHHGARRCHRLPGRPTRCRLRRAPGAASAGVWSRRNIGSSTHRLVDRLGEQALLEELLEESKTDLALACGLDPLLATPFRYDAIYPTGSRFRRAGHSHRGLLRRRTAGDRRRRDSLHRLLFFAESPATPWRGRRGGPSPPSPFGSPATRGLDLTLPAARRDRAAWTA